MEEQGRNHVYEQLGEMEKLYELMEGTDDPILRAHYEDIMLTKEGELHAHMMHRAVEGLLDFAGYISGLEEISTVAALEKAKGQVLPVCAHIVRMHDQENPQEGS